MKTKPFSLEKALAGHPVVTREGRRVTQIAYFPAAVYGVYALVDGDPCVGSYSNDGKKYQKAEDRYDLFLEAKTVKRWARVLRKDRTRVPEFFCDFDSKEEAEAPTLERDLEVLSAYEYEVEE